MCVVPMPGDRKTGMSSGKVDCQAAKAGEDSDKQQPAAWQQLQKNEKTCEKFCCEIGAMGKSQNKLFGKVLALGDFS